MGTHPLNLAFRFLLELSALGSLATLGWVRFESPERWLAALGLPLLFATVWGTFAVPDDPSRGGGAPIPVPGWFRLTLEMALFSASAYALALADHPRLTLAFALSVILHYALSVDRITWLLER